MSAVRLPPFARELVAARLHGVRPNVHVCLTWERAKLRAPPHVLLLPPGEPPEAFNWACCRGLDVTVQGTSEPDQDRLERLAHALLRAGAQLVVVLFRKPDGVIGAAFFRTREVDRVA